MTKTKAYTFITLGTALIFSAAVIYYDFFLPKIGPLGSGERPMITYIMYGSNVFLAVFIILRGAWEIRRSKQQK